MPVGKLFRLTAVLVVLMPPAFWAVASSGAFAPPPCSPCPPYPAVEQYWSDEAGQSLTVTLVAEVAVILVWIVVAVLRGKVRPGAALRWTPLTLAVLYLNYLWFMSVMVGPDLPLALWLAAPLAFHAIHRADPAAIVWVLAALVVSAAEAAPLSAYGLEAGDYLPLVIILVYSAVLGARRWQLRSQARVDRF